MRFKNILLDFDGTIAESGVGIINGVEYACRQMGLAEGEPWKDWRKYIGPTVYRFTTVHLGLDEAGRDRFMELYKHYNKTKGIFESPLYPGMGQLLKDLRAAGARLYICSSKPEELTLLAVDYLQLALDGVCSMVPGRVHKNDVMAYTLQTYGIDPSQSVMIGDRDSDVIAGQLFGLSTIGVTYGYGSVEEMNGCGATFVADSVDDLRKILL